ncbi:MAG: hypothetical protein JKY22_10085, partial [Flavobacteriaceae bacterium]|nr:hypothetical protein [Flavobacteriaceae bacterium]
NLLKSVQNIKDHYPNRFVVFANVDFNGVGEEGWGQKVQINWRKIVRTEHDI